MTIENKYFAKELSWLSFNERVLQEAADEDNPVIERVRFLGIYSSNMDEFFRVRVADVKRQVLIGEEQGDKGPTDLMKLIQVKVKALTNKFDDIYRDLVLKLARHKIFLIDEKKLSEFHEAWLRRYFYDNIIRHISPIIITDNTDLEHVLNDSSVYLLVAMRKGSEVQYSTVEVPTGQVTRFIQLPSEKTKTIKKVILLDDVIVHFIGEVFNAFFQFESIEAYSFKMTRDAEYDLKDEIDTSIVENMSDGLKQRLTADPVRYVYDSEMPQDMLEFLAEKLNLSFDSMHAGTRYRNFKDFIGFPNIGRKYLENHPVPPLTNQQFHKHQSTFDAIREKDILLYYPYHKFFHFTEFVRQAAYDPTVNSIRLNIYRVASNSLIIESLIDAVKNGKQVTVVVELKARFDEENNIEWAKTMTEAGIRVSFGIPSLKVHSKLCLISREENGNIVRYAHLGTGNFNEKTAKIYTDFSLYTANQEIAQEVYNVFEFIEHSYKRFPFKHLMVSPLNSRKKIYQLIDTEIENATAGKKAEMIIKINNLVDKGVVDRLYKASNAGVKVKMILRGMCQLVPGVRGLSENIQIISVVDRFLEHPRVMVFHNGGDKKVYISSADWMTRNIEHRVEVGCPIYDEKLKQQIIDILNIQLSDTTKARVIDSEQSNKYVKRGRRKKIRSQIAIYEYLMEQEASS